MNTYNIYITSQNTEEEFNQEIWQLKIDQDHPWSDLINLEYNDSCLFAYKSQDIVDDAFIESLNEILASDNEDSFIYNQDIYQLELIQD